MEFSRQEYWSWLPFSSPGDLPNTGIEPGSPALLADSLLTELWGKPMIKSRWYIKKQRHYFTDKGLSSQSYGFSSSHLWVWELDHKESWVLENWCIWTVVLEKTLESLLDSKEIKPVQPKEISPEYSLKKGLMMKLKLQYFGHLMQRVNHWKRPWCWERFKAGEGNNKEGDAWMASLTDGHEFEQAPGVGDGQGSLVCFSQWGRQDMDTTERLN